MKSINKKAPNCINTPAECTQWNSGNIEYLGVCNGDYLPEIIWEIVNKLKAIAGEDLSSFDIDGLLDICNAKAPLEINLLSILTLLRDNEICLKEYIDVLDQKIQEITGSTQLILNLKCLADDEYNLGISQEDLNQLVVNEICAQKERIVSLEGQMVTVKNDINILNNKPAPAAVEPTFTTCVDSATKSTSNQVKSIATEYCDYKNNFIGIKSDVSLALSHSPKVWTDAAFINLLTTTKDSTGTPLINYWDANAKTLAESHNNLLVAYALLQIQTANILATCCAPNCDAIKIGFSIIPGDNPNDFVVRFRNTDGTVIPSGYTDAGSTITFTDINGVTYGPLPINVTEEESDSYNLSGMTLTKPVFVTINSKVSNGSLYCEKCVGKSINLNDAACPVCEVTASGTGSVTIVYQVN